MFVLSRRLMVEEKINQLSNGYGAYAESDQVINLMLEEIEKQQIPVIYDITDSGCWFIPESQ